MYVLLRIYDIIRKKLYGGDIMGVMDNLIVYISYFNMFFNWGMKILGIYMVYVVIKALKIYIKNNS